MFETGGGWGLLCSGPLRSLRAGLAEGQLWLHLLWGPLPWAGQGLRRELFRPQCTSSEKPSQIAQLFTGFVFCCSPTPWQLGSYLFPYWTGSP